MSKKDKKKTKQKEKLVIIDGNGLAYRAFYALPPLKTSRGEPVSAVYGFTNMLLKVLEREKPDYIAVAFDKSKPTRRQEEYEEYKAHRQKMPEELQVQFPIIEEVVKAFKIPVFYEEGYEADDCIATLARKAEQRDIFTRIYSGDLDMLQLVSKNNQVVTTRRGISDLVVYDRERVKKRYGIEPSQLVDYKALAGDSSDHIPGIPGIGEASASKLLNRFDNIEHIYNEPEKIPSRWKKQILENKEQAFMSKKLVSLEDDMDLDVDWDKMKTQEPDRETLKDLLIRLEFKSLLKKMGFKEEDLREIQEIIVQIVGKDEDLDTMLDRLKSGDCFSLYWVLNEEGKMAGLAIAEGSTNGYYFPFILPAQLNITSTFGISTFSQDRIFHELKPLMKSGKIIKYLYDLKDGIRHFKLPDYFTGEGFVDLYIASILLDPDYPPSSLEDVLARHSDFKPRTLAEMMNTQKGRNKFKVEEVPLQDLTLFAAGRAVRINNLGHKIKKDLEDNQLMEIFQELEVPLTSLISLIQQRGIHANREQLEKEYEKLQEQIDQITSEVYQEVGHEFNLNSTKQLGKVLFEELKLPGAKPTDTSYRTSAEVLKKIIDEHPVVEKILKYREISKAKTYVNSLLDSIDPQSGRIYPVFKQNGTPTGRITTTSPNLNTLPLNYRRMLTISDEEKTLLLFDLDQLVVRVLAHLSEDEKLIEDLQPEGDFHRKFAARLFDIDPDEVDQETRNKAKEVCYSIIYGLSAHALSKKLDIKRSQAKNLKKKFLSVYPGVNKFKKKVLEEARENEIVRTMMGRLRKVPGVNSQNKNSRSSDEKKALSHVVDGSAADVLKKAMLDCLENILRNHRDLQLLLPINDQLLFETRTRRAEKYTQQIKEILENSTSLKVPLKITVKQGLNWLDMEEKK